MFIQKRDLRGARGLGFLGSEQELKEVVIQHHESPHWVVKTVLGSVISTAILLIAWKKFM